MSSKRLKCSQTGDCAAVVKTYPKGYWLYRIVLREAALPEFQTDDDWDRCVRPLAVVYYTWSLLGI